METLKNHNRLTDQFVNETIQNTNSFRRSVRIILILIAAACLICVMHDAINDTETSTIKYKTLTVEDGVEYWNNEIVKTAYICYGDTFNVKPCLK